MEPNVRKCLTLLNNLLVNTWTETWSTQGFTVFSTGLPMVIVTNSRVEYSNISPGLPRVIVTTHQVESSNISIATEDYIFCPPSLPGDISMVDYPTIVFDTECSIVRFHSLPRFAFSPRVTTTARPLDLHNITMPRATSLTFTTRVTFTPCITIPSNKEDSLTFSPRVIITMPMANSWRRVSILAIIPSSTSKLVVDLLLLPLTISRQENIWRRNCQLGLITKLVVILLNLHISISRQLIRRGKDCILRTVVKLAVMLLPITISRKENYWRNDCMLGTVFKLVVNPIHFPFTISRKESN